jgi:hypothetical protein
MSGSEVLVLSKVLFMPNRRSSTQHASPGQAARCTRYAFDGERALAPKPMDALRRTLAKESNADHMISSRQFFCSFTFSTPTSQLVLDGQQRQLCQFLDFMWDKTTADAALSRASMCVWSCRTLPFSS